MNLGELFTAHGSDKESTHHYGALYERHLGHLREETFKLLEIGVDRGGSLKAWQEWFSSASIFGLDVMDRRDLRDPDGRIYIAKGDQSDPAVLEALGDFDVIIDDGSHQARDVCTSFRFLWPHVNAGGTYVIEDVQTSYWPTYGGGPPGYAGTAIALAKSLVDELNRDGWAGPETSVAWLTFYPNIVFVGKRP